MATDSILRPGEIKGILLREIEAANLGQADTADVGTTLEVRDGVARIYGLEPAQIIWRRIRDAFGGKAAYAEIVGVVRDVRHRGPEGAAGGS